MVRVDGPLILVARASERVFVGFAIFFALLFFPVSRIGFDGMLYRLGGAEESYGTVASDTVEVDTQERAALIYPRSAAKEASTRGLRGGYSLIGDRK